MSAGSLLAPLLACPLLWPWPAWFEAGSSILPGVNACLVQGRCSLPSVSRVGDERPGAAHSFSQQVGHTTHSDPGALRAWREWCSAQPAWARFTRLCWCLVGLSLWTHSQADHPTAVSCADRGGGALSPGALQRLHPENPSGKRGCCSWWVCFMTAQQTAWAAWDSRAYLCSCGSHGAQCRSPTLLQEGARRPAHCCLTQRGPQGREMQAPARACNCRLA